MQKKSVYLSLLLAATTLFSAAGILFAQTKPTPNVELPDVSIKKLHTPLLEQRGCYVDTKYNMSVRVLRVLEDKGLYLANITSLKDLKTKRLVFNMAALNALALKNYQKVDCGTGEVTDEKLSY